MSQDPRMLALTIGATDLVQMVGSEAAASATNNTVDGAADKTVDVSGSELLIAKESESVSAAVTVAVITTAAAEPASTAAANDLELNFAQVCICYALCALNYTVPISLNIQKHLF